MNKYSWATWGGAGLAVASYATAVASLMAVCLPGFVAGVVGLYLGTGAAHWGVRNSPQSSESV